MSKKTAYNNKIAIKSIAKRIISNNRTAYKGNLIYWIKEKLPKATNEEIEIVFHELADEGFFFTASGIIYPPNYTNPGEIQITKFISQFGLSMMDLDILTSILKINEENLLKERKPELSTLSRLIVSQCTCYDEIHVKIRIQELLISKILIAIPSNQNPKSIEVNWKLIKEVLYEKYSC